MAPNPRVAMAFRAMREIGIIEEKVKPVLKNLLKLYDKNWQLIEEENYRALADAIFDQEESQVNEQKRNDERAEVRDMEEEAHVNEEPERVLKRSRRNQEVPSSSSIGHPISRPNGFSLKQPKEEVVELPEDTSEGSHPLSCPPLVRKKGKQPILQDPTLNSADRTLALATNGKKVKGKEPILSQSPDRSTPAVLSLKEPKVEPVTIISTTEQEIKSKVLTKPKDEPITDDVPQPVPLAVVQPEPLDAANSSLVSDSPRNKCTNREALTMVEGSLSILDMDTSNNREEIIKSTPAIDMQNQRNGASDALDVIDKAISHDNGSSNSENVNDLAQALVPTKTPFSNGNNCNEKQLNEAIDIANGLEKVVISCINEVNDECPPSFRYIPQNVVYQSAYVNFSLARIGENCCSDCSGDCLLSSIPCACANESGGEYAYTSEGLVKEDILKESVSMNRDPENHCHFYCNACPLERNENNGVVGKCQGHLMRRFIKECWRKCGCDNKCGNRVVQRGITRKLQVFMTPEGKGWGIRTLEDLPEGAFVCEYVGEILTNAELFERVSQTSSGELHSYPVLLDADWGAEGVLKDEEALCLDATHYGNVARFVNHRCVDSNMVEIPVEVETPDHHYYHLAFFTTREVKALEELTWDYGINFDDKRHPVKAFKCRCGSKFCRNLKRYNRKIRYGRRR